MFFQGSTSFLIVFPLFITVLLVAVDAAPAKTKGKPYKTGYTTTSWYMKSQEAQKPKFLLPTAPPNWLNYLHSTSLPAVIWPTLNSGQKTKKRYGSIDQSTQKVSRPSRTSSNAMLKMTHNDDDQLLTPYNNDLSSFMASQLLPPPGTVLLDLSAFTDYYRQQAIEKYNRLRRKDIFNRWLRQMADDTSEKHSIEEESWIGDENIDFSDEPRAKWHSVSKTSKPANQANQTPITTITTIPLRIPLQTQQRSRITSNSTGIISTIPEQQTKRQQYEEVEEETSEIQAIEISIVPTGSDRIQRTTTATIPIKINANSLTKNGILLLIKPLQSTQISNSVKTPTEIKNTKPLRTETANQSLTKTSCRPLFLSWPVTATPATKQVPIHSTAPRSAEQTTYRTQFLGPPNEDPHCYKAKVIPKQTLTAMTGIELTEHHGMPEEHEKSRGTMPMTNAPGVCDQFEDIVLSGAMPLARVEELCVPVNQSPNSNFNPSDYIDEDEDDDVDIDNDEYLIEENSSTREAVIVAAEHYSNNNDCSTNYNNIESTSSSNGSDEFASKLEIGITSALDDLDFDVELFMKSLLNNNEDNEKNNNSTNISSNSDNNKYSSANQQPAMDSLYHDIYPNNENPLCYDSVDMMDASMDFAEAGFEISTEDAVDINQMTTYDIFGDVNDNSSYFTHSQGEQPFLSEAASLVQFSEEPKMPDYDPEDEPKQSSGEVSTQDFVLNIDPEIPSSYAFSKIENLECDVPLSRKRRSVGNAVQPSKMLRLEIQSCSNIFKLSGQSSTEVLSAASAIPSTPDVMRTILEFESSQVVDEYEEEENKLGIKIEGHDVVSIYNELVNSSTSVHSPEEAIQCFDGDSKINVRSKQSNNLLSARPMTYTPVSSPAPASPALSNILSVASPGTTKRGRGRPAKEHSDQPDPAILAVMTAEERRHAENRAKNNEASRMSRVKSKKKADEEKKDEMIEQRKNDKLESQLHKLQKRHLSLLGVLTKLR